MNEFQHRINEYLIEDNNGRFQKNRYDSVIVFDHFDGLNWDLDQEGFFHNGRAVYHHEGNCGCLITYEDGDTVDFGKDHNHIYFLIRNCSNMRNNYWRNRT